MTDDRAERRLDELTAAGLAEPAMRPQHAPEHTGKVVSPESLAEALAWDRDDTVDDVIDEALAAVARDLVMTVVVVVPGAPWVLAGMIDGRAWCLRERGGIYTVVLGDEGVGGVTPWSTTGAGTVVARGTIEDLLDADRNESPELALRVAAAAVRTHLRQTTCTHEAAGAGARHCPLCGVALVAPWLP